MVKRQDCLRSCGRLLLIFAADGTRGDVEPVLRFHGYCILRSKNRMSLMYGQAASYDNTTSEEEQMPAANFRPISDDMSKAQHGRPAPIKIKSQPISASSISSITIFFLPIKNLNLFVTYFGMNS